MFNTLKSKNNAIEILKDYKKINPYILKLKRDIITYQKISLLTPFVVEYIIKNENTEIKPIGKIVPIADWYGEKLKNEYNIEFIPKKIQILTLIGETSSVYHCVIKYRQNMSPLEIFINKKAILVNFLINDYHNIQIDFDRYDILSRNSIMFKKKGEIHDIMPHQKEAVQFLLDRKKCILADDMGVGKSLELTVAGIEGNFDAILIICPANVKSNWKEELMWYVPEKDITIVESFKDKTKSELENFLGYKEGKSNLTVKELKEEAIEKGKWCDNRFVIVNFDIIDEFFQIPANKSKMAKEIAINNSPILQFILNKKSLIIIDEAQRLSSNDSIRYKVVKNLINKGNPHSIYLATGTPMTNDPSNLFNLLKLLNESICNDWEFYMKRYCGGKEICMAKDREKRNQITSNFIAQHNKNNWYDLTDKEKEDLNEIIKKNCRIQIVSNKEDIKNLDELKLRISHIYLRRVKEDISTSLPKKNVYEIFYDLNDKQKEEYSKLWEEYEKSRIKTNPTQDINKDLLEGAVYRKYCSNQMIPNTIKLADKFISNGEKVIIACCYDEELQKLQEYYGEKCVIYNGKMLPKQKEKAKKDFIENPDIMVFIGNIIAAGVGITLIVSHKLIFNNIDYVPASCRQMEDRCYRIGQKNDVDIYYQMFKGTQYEKIWNTVMKKELIINQVIKKESEK